MLTQTYGNGDTVHYAYDTFDRLVSKTLDDGDVVRYYYNAEGAVARIARERDGVEQDGYEFTYDSLGRLIRSEQYGTAAQRTEHRYDAYGRLSSQSWVLGNRSFSETYGYNDGASGDGTLNTLTAATGDTLQYGYDALRRLQSVAVGSRFTTAYAYEALANGNTASRIQYRNVRLGGSGTLLEGAKYTYDAWGNILSSSGTMAEKNPLRYRGYYYDSETGYYYLQSRYYDPTTRRFLNADSLASTGQGFVGTDMFAYCGNNPTSRIDPTGQSFADIWEFIEDAISEIGSAFKELTPVFTSCGGFAAADGPLPIGDIVGASIAVGAAFGIVGYGVYRAAKPKSRATESSADDEAIAAIAASAIRPLSSLVFFPEDPNDFRPRGLYLKKYDGRKNGKIYLWVDPVTDIPIFEWNEDLAHGPHYHVMLPEWKGKHHGLHYWAGEPVPEPWSSICFGG